MWSVEQLPVGGFSLRNSPDSDGAAPQWNGVKPFLANDKAAGWQCTFMQSLQGGRI